MHSTEAQTVIDPNKFVKWCMKGQTMSSELKCHSVLIYSIFIFVTFFSHSFKKKIDEGNYETRTPIQSLPRCVREFLVFPPLTFTFVLTTLLTSEFLSPKFFSTLKDKKVNVSEQWLLPVLSSKITPRSIIFFCKSIIMYT